MSNSITPVLCGGTFFALMLEARKDRTSKRRGITGKTDGLSQPELLVELVRIIKPTFLEPEEKSGIEKNAGNYKQCKDNGGTYFAAVFESNDTVLFDERVKNNYDVELSKTFALTEQFIGDDKAEWLIKALIEVIEKDDSTEDASFIIDSKKLSRNDIVNLDSVSLPGFILGVWHYITQNAKDNTVGNHTFKKWHRKKGEANSEWIFDSDIGSGIKRKITILPFENSAAESSINEQSDYVCDGNIETDEPIIIEEPSESEAPETNQTVIVNGNLYNAKNQIFGNIDKLYIG